MLILFCSPFVLRQRKSQLRTAQAYAQGPVARSMVIVNQRLIPCQLIGFDTA